MICQRTSLLEKLPGIKCGRSLIRCNGENFKMTLPADPYPIIAVDTWPAAGDEMMGTKPKIWLSSADDGPKWLFKQKARAHSEDDWSEKVAGELAELFGIPHAAVELANRNGSRGVLSRDLLHDFRATEFIPGNRLLVEEDPDYPTETRYHLAKHTVDRVFRVLEAGVGLPAWPGVAAGVSTACDLFTGYLLFDAWIANTDRHHENWAVLRTADGSLVLSPSYDHASSLGHNLSDVARHERLTTRDRNQTVEAFVAKARSALYREETAPAAKPVATAEAFRLAVERRPAAGTAWLDKLRNVQDGDVTDILRRAPAVLMSDVAKAFVEALLQTNRRRLLSARA